MGENNNIGHLLAMLTVFLWGTTFISTKILLTGFEPVEILFFRFVIAFAVLALACPKRIKNTNLRQEIIFALAGLFGICLYYLMENIALTYTMASNVGVIVSVAPFFTAIAGHIVFKDGEKLYKSFFVGFIVAMAGISLISFNGAELHLNPKGDILALAAAAIWACYSVCVKKIESFGYNTIVSTRRIFFYGIIFMIPALKIFGFNPDLSLLAQPKYLGNMLFLALGASAVCFVTWNYALKLIGVVKSSVYIYMTPVVTVVASFIVLHERITLMAATGTLLTLAGLILSEGHTAADIIKRTIFKKFDKKSDKNDKKWSINE